MFFFRNSSKYGGGPYDYSYSSRLPDSARQPVAQKKHHMFGKRFFQEQSSTVPALPQAAAQQSSIPIKYEYEPYGMHHTPAIPHSLEGAVGPAINKQHPGGAQLGPPELKYSCSLDFARQNRGADLVGHNHTYTLPQGTGASPRPQARDKKQRKIDDEHLSRDEKRARALNVNLMFFLLIFSIKQFLMVFLCFLFNLFFQSRFQCPLQRSLIYQWTSLMNAYQNMILPRHNYH